MNRLVESVQLSRCTLCWGTRFDGSGRRNVEIRDIKTGMSATVALRPVLQFQPNTMETYAATSSPCAFAVCNPYGVSRSHFQVYCVDPNVSGGIRWSVDSPGLEGSAGPRAVSAAFARHLTSPCRYLPLFVNCINKDDVSSYLMFLDEGTGAVLRRFKLPGNVLDSVLPIISPDNRLVVADVSLERFGIPQSKLAVDDWWKLSDDEWFRTQFRVIDLESGNVRNTQNLYGRIACRFLQGFLGADRALLADDYALWVLEIGKEVRLTELFRISDDPNRRTR
jgi:hypothetical protein